MIRVYSQREVINNIVEAMDAPGFIELFKMKEIERISKPSTRAKTKQADSSRALLSQINQPREIKTAAPLLH